MSSILFVAMNKLKDARSDSDKEKSMISSGGSTDQSSNLTWGLRLSDRICNMSNKFTLTVAVAIVMLGSFTVNAISDIQSFPNPLCGAKALDFKTDCAKRSSIITPTTQSWSFTGPGATSNVVVSVRFVGKHRASV
jgi:hypothetical protein